MRPINLFHKIISTLLIAAMVITLIPADVVLADPNPGTNLANTALNVRDTAYQISDNLTDSYAYSAMIAYAITPYNLGSENNSDNIYNKYVLGRKKDGGAYTKNDLIYQYDVNKKGKWGYILPTATKDASKGVYAGAFTEADNDAYMPTIGNSLATLKGDIKTNNSGVIIETPSNKEKENATVGNISVDDSVPLFNIYPEYKNMFSHEQQYQVGAVSNLYFTQILKKDSLIFVSGDFVYHDIGEHFAVYYTSEEGLTGNYTNSGIDDDKSNLVYSKMDNDTRSTRIVDTQATDLIARPYMRAINMGGDTKDYRKITYKNPTYETTGTGKPLTTQFYEDIIKADKDGGVFYDWLINQGIFSNDTTLDQLHVEKYEIAPDNTLNRNDALADKDADILKYSVGPQTNYDKLKSIPSAVEALLGQSSSKELIKEAVTLWQYILGVPYQIGKANVRELESGDYYSIDQKVSEFMRMGCEYSVKNFTTKWMPKLELDPETGAPVVTLTDSSIVTAIHKLFNGTTPDIMFSGFDEAAKNKFEYLSSLYNAHYLDLLICAYACAYNNDRNSSTTKAWKEALERYCMTKDDSNGWNTNGCSIQITPCNILFSYATPNGKTTPESVRVLMSAYDYQMLFYQAESIGTSEKDDIYSLNRAFMGYDVGNGMIIPETVFTGDPINPNETTWALSNSGAYSNDPVSQSSQKLMWVYASSYTTIKRYLEQCIKNNKKITEWQTYNRGSFLGSGAANRYFRYLYAIKPGAGESKYAAEYATNSPWAREFGGVLSNIQHSSGMQKLPLSLVNNTFSAGSMLLIAYQWENTYAAKVDGKGHSKIDLRFKLADTKDESKDNTHLYVDLNSKEESEDYTVTKDGNTAIINFNTEADVTATVFDDVTASVLSDTMLNVGTAQAYVKAIRYEDKVLDDEDLLKDELKPGGLLAENGGLLVQGQLLAKDKLDCPLEDPVNYATTSGENLVYDGYWHITPDDTLTEEDVKNTAIPLGQVFFNKEKVYDIITGKECVEGPEELILSFGNNFKDSVSYEIDIAYNVSAALSAKIKEEKIKNPFYDEKTGITKASGEIILTVQYTPSKSESAVYAYDVETGNILGKVKDTDINLGTNTLIELVDGDVETLKEGIVDKKQYTLASKAEASAKPATVVQINNSYLFSISNYGSLLKNASKKIAVEHGAKDGKQTYKFTVDQPSAGTYLLVPVKEEETNVVRVVAYYEANTGNVVKSVAEEISKDKINSKMKFETQITGVDDVQYIALDDESKYVGFNGNGHYAGMLTQTSCHNRSYFL